MGKHIGGDKARLKAAYGVTTEGTLELGRLASDRQLVTDAGLGLAALVRTLLNSTLSKEDSVRLSDWSVTLGQEQHKYAALDAYASLAVYKAIVAAGSAIPAHENNLSGMDLFLTDASGTERVARCRVARAQPEKHGSFKVSQQSRVWLEVIDVLVPGFVLLFVVRRQPGTLKALCSDARCRGSPAILVASREHLRDARHPLEVQLTEERRVGKTAVPAVEEGDGRYDAFLALTAAARPMCDNGRVGEKASPCFDDEDSSSDEDEPDGASDLRQSDAHDASDDSDGGDTAASAQHVRGGEDGPMDSGHRRSEASGGTCGVPVAGSRQPCDARGSDGDPVATRNRTGGTRDGGTCASDKKWGWWCRC